MKGMILAAGYGKRMRPLSSVLPKPLLPVANIPAIEYSINLFKNNGVESTVINTYYKKEDIQDFFKDKTGLGVDIQFSHEEMLLGTAGGIKRAEKFLREDTFFVINSDIIVDIDLKEVIRFHREKGALITMVLRRDEDAERYGIIGVDSESRVKRFLREGADNRGLTDTMFTGIQVFEPGALNEIPSGRPCELPLEVYPRLISKGYPVFGYITDKYWMDMGSHKKYLKAHHDILSNKYPPFKEIAREKNISLNVHEKFIDKNVRIIPPVIIDESCSIKEGCSVGPNVVLGKNSVLDRGVSIKESVVWENAALSDNAEISNSIIGSSVRIEKKSGIENKIVIKENGRERIYPVNEDYF